MSDWRMLGDRAVRLVRPQGPSPRALVDAIRRWPGVTDVVVSRDHVGVYFSGTPRPSAQAISDLQTLPRDSGSGRVVTLHATYDGADLDDVARATGMSVDDVVAAHVGQTYLVETIGFAPGFAYLTGLDARLHRLPRRASPRTRVPAGALAIAGGYCGVYPFQSPGGWNLIGHVQEQMFGPQGALLQLGDSVRFVQ